MTLMQVENARNGCYQLDVQTSFVSLTDILRWRAVHQAQSVAFRFLQYGEDASCTMTYAEVNSEVCKLAGRLQEAKLAGDRVLLLYPPGPAALIAMLACLSVGVVAVPLSLPRPNRTCARWEAVALDAQPSAVLTAMDGIRRGPDGLQQLLERHRLPILVADVADGAIHEWSPPSIEPDTIAYLQYTSGSTTAPKGVVISHGNIWHNCRALAEVVDEWGPHVGVSWLPLSHDMGLVGTVFLPLWMGFPIVFMPPEAFLMKPVRWLAAISRYGATISPAPDFAYDLCARRIPPDQRWNLDLSRWRFAFNGAERVSSSSLDRFVNTFQSSGFRPEAFYPCYGLAESTLFVAGGKPQQRSVVRRFDRSSLAAGEAVLSERGIPLVSCGHSQGGANLIIVDPVTRKSCPSGRIGEIWITGPSVAAGYWNNPQATAEAFYAHTSETKAGSFLRTGDLGFLWNDELFVTGRLKDLIIIGGRNITAEDIEAAAESAHPAICADGAIAFAVEGEPQERLILVVEVTPDKSQPREGESIKCAIRDAVSLQNDVALAEVVLVRCRTTPKTPNGKKMRSACREAFLSGTIRGRIDA